MLILCSEPPLASWCTQSSSSELCYTIQDTDGVFHSCHALCLPLTSHSALLFFSFFFFCGMASFCGMVTLVSVLDHWTFDWLGSFPIQTSTQLVPVSPCESGLQHHPSGEATLTTIFISSLHSLPLVHGLLILLITT